MDTPANQRSLPAPKEWIEALARGQADIEAGRTHDLEDVLRDIDNDIAELEGRPLDQSDEAEVPRMGR